MIVRLGTLHFRPFSIQSLYTLIAVSCVTFTLYSFSVLPYPPTAHVVVTPVIDIFDLHRKPLEQHTYTPDGLLVVNPNGPHPIFELMHNAEEKWRTKLARASTTLDEAVMEYERRYNRSPPIGFDKWWDYVVRHGVQLPDEYDEIYHDLEPFWGLDPEDLARARDKAMNGPEVITFEKTASSSTFEFVHSTLTGETTERTKRITDMFDLIGDIEHELPPMRVIFAPDDTPRMFSQWTLRNMALEAVKNGSTVKREDFPPFTKADWVEGCPPNSPARNNPPPPPPLSPPPHLGFSPQFILNTSAPKTFIVSHQAAMDPCMHPELLVTHGQFLAHKTGPVPDSTLMPQISLCKTPLHHDIRVPVPYGWLAEDRIGRDDSPWWERVDERLNWRGTTTGLFANPDKAWGYSHRSRLVSLANSMDGNLTVLPVPSSEYEPVGEPGEVRKARVNPAWMDIAFVDKPNSCDEDKGTCREMAGSWEFRRRQGRKEEGRYKFIFDVDGNGWSGRFQRLMSSNALVFKATVYPEWYTSRIAPWVHYVPIQLSYTDLHDAVAFFRVHDDLAARIATQGKEWSRTFWRKEDMAAYLYRLFLEYARVMSEDRAAMSYVGGRVSLDADL
ncbi:hypothetical protein ID866_5829 [Astraeus odoratus]|nr:hypothetical protein ID866_5829 [Astraeus odoratus]